MSLHCAWCPLNSSYQNQWVITGSILCLVNVLSSSQSLCTISISNPRICWSYHWFQYRNGVVSKSVVFGRFVCGSRPRLLFWDQCHSCPNLKKRGKRSGFTKIWLYRVDCEERLAAEQEVGCLPVRWERRHNAGLGMVITPTSRTAGVETLECFEAENVICATVLAESGSITFVEPHHQVLTSVMCENIGLY